MTFEQFLQQVLRTQYPGNRALVLIGLGRCLPWTKWRGWISWRHLSRWCGGLSVRTLQRAIEWLKENTDWIAVEEQVRGRIKVAIRTEALMSAAPRPRPWETDDDDDVDGDFVPVPSPSETILPDEQPGWMVEDVELGDDPSAVPVLEDVDEQLGEQLDIADVAGDDELDRDREPVDVLAEDDVGGEDEPAVGSHPPPCPHEVVPDLPCRLAKGHDGLCEPVYRPPTACATASATVHSATASAHATAASGLKKFQDILELIKRRIE